MGENYAIGNSIYDAHGAVQFTTFFYEQLRGIKAAATKAGLTKLELENFFYNNIYNLLSEIII
jgi:hypothetical protein